MPSGIVSNSHYTKKPYLDGPTCSHNQLFVHHLLKPEIISLARDYYDQHLCCLQSDHVLHLEFGLICLCLGSINILGTIWYFPQCSIYIIKYITIYHQYLLVPREKLNHATYARVQYKPMLILAFIDFG